MAFDPYRAATVGESTSCSDYYPHSLNGSCDGWIDEERRQSVIEERVGDQVEAARDAHRRRLAACGLAEMFGDAKEGNK